MKQLSISTKLTNRDNDSLRQYFKEINSYPKFTPQEEAECASKAVLGDRKALQELINRNLRFVVSVAKQYETKDSPLGDLINEGNLGLIDAANRFDPTLGFKFISYSVWWIRKYITESLTNDGRTVRIPANKVNQLAKLTKKMSTLEQKIGRSVDIEDIISEYGLDENDDEVKSINLINVSNVDSLDRDISSDGEGVSLIDILNDDGYYSKTDQLLIDSDIKIKINQIINTLSLKEREIISALYGLNGLKPHTLAEVGEKYDVTRESIRLTKERILLKLRVKTKNLHYLHV